MKECVSLDTVTFKVTFFLFTALWLIFVLELANQQHYNLSVLSIIIYFVIFGLLTLYEYIRTNLPLKGKGNK